MTKKLNINLYYNDAGETILDVLMKDFNDFLNDYIKKVLKDKKLYNKISSNAKKLGVNNSATLIYEEIKKLTNN